MPAGGAGFEPFAPVGYLAALHAGEERLVSTAEQQSLESGS
jgi:hypothetical protein